MKKTLTCSFITLGCKVNQYETDFMTQSLLKEGYQVKPISSNTDYVIINTCTVTNEADRKSRQQIRRAKKIAPNATTIGIGCSIQVMSPEKGKIADYHFGNGEKGNLVNIISAIETGNSLPSIDRAYWLRHDQLTYSLTDSGSKTRQNIMIQEGCTNACTYCKIFHARGTKTISKNPDLIVSEINEIGEKTCQEFILTGINLGAYEWKGLNLAGLLKKIDNQVNPNYRIRLSSLNPEDVTDELCEQMKKVRYCPHLHLSIQSGSDNVLKKMNRKYTSDDVLYAVEKLRDIDPLYSISCDMIVGFPGELSKDFDKTLELIQRIEPLKTHVFRYSMKKGTPAATFKNQIDGRIKKKRLSELVSFAKEVSYKVRHQHIGKEREIIVECQIDETVTGHDEYYLKHNFINNGPTFSEGKKIKTKITEVLENSEPDEVNASIVSIY